LSTSETERREGARLPDLDSVYTINPDGSRNFLHPADVNGRWQKRKNLIFTLLIFFYVLLPWVEIRGHPAILVDISQRQAFLFGHSYTNQDIYLLFFLVSGFGFLLFVVTSLWGRIWCGFACPQTVWLEGVFRRLERILEGPREVRIRRNRGPWNADKLLRKGAKQAAFLLLAFWLSHLFIAYFVPLRQLVHIVIHSPAGHMTAFVWVLVMTAVLYFDFAWFREQTCTVVCPYGRLQSALIDADTVLIGYDDARGEPRSKAANEGGDCIDCRRCVVVCPTGIDIRNGLQLECIGCANCVDACDEIMDRISRPRGLVRYDSQHGFGGARRTLRRPRVFLYAALGLVGATVFLLAASRRTDFEVRALRQRGMPYVLEQETIQNLFNLDVQNKEAVRRVYSVRALLPATAPGAELQVILAEPRIVLEGNADQTVPVFMRLPRSRYQTAVPLQLAVRDSASNREKRVTVEFLGPE